MDVDCHIRSYKTLATVTMFYHEIYNVFQENKWTINVVVLYG